MTTLSKDFLDALAPAVEPCDLRTGNVSEILDSSINKKNLDADIVVTPTSTEQVSALVRLCAEHGVPRPTGRTYGTGGCRNRSRGRW